MKRTFASSEKKSTADIFQEILIFRTATPESICGQLLPTTSSEFSIS